MDLNSGDKSGDRYQFLSKLGEGGGDIWKARDMELDRDVPVKVSKSEFTAQVKQEARTIAAFVHPNICLAKTAHRTRKRRQRWHFGQKCVPRWATRMRLISAPQLTQGFPVRR